MTEPTNTDAEAKRLASWLAMVLPPTASEAFVKGKSLETKTPEMLQFLELHAESFGMKLMMVADRIHCEDRVAFAKGVGFGMKVVSHLADMYASTAAAALAVVDASPAQKVDS